MHPTASNPITLPLPSSVPTVARKGLRLLQRIHHGRLHIELPGGQQILCGNGHGVAASLRLRNWNVFNAVLRAGDIGLAESYIDEDWSTPHLSNLLRLLIANRDQLESMVYGSWWGRLGYRLRHLLRRNTKANSRKNIHAHYDLGNRFYQLWLDPSMNYSSAWFEGNLNGDFTQAQYAKIHRALRCANVQTGNRVLEIGCGWGALAEVAATHYQANVVGVTLSTEQLAYGQQRMLEVGMQDHVDLRLQDYRDIQDGPFDAICSIEMLEAVGQAYWPTYFSHVHRLLKSGGRACIQSIVIDDKLFDRYAQGTDFIQQYIFPGGCLPSAAHIRDQAQRAGLRVEAEFAFGQDYAETLRRWQHNFQQQQTKVLAQGFDTRFLDTWAFYLAYCEAAFSMRNIEVVQFTLIKD